ncbi:CHAT domain-containing protein [Nostoc sp. CENA67]|uniref:CHAT domain-containing protein n=1 Tax=Amazonocrinis nigriterrae CENA67 TaxID=2794033 RepID=A0A8J7HUK3_9NOST|nr:CHAT domain-containing tetratricopeptide repeat protein [Amazonocrinis nigriterrae]MBH8562824.1 CHAT domain-containing protein [Amazonocrinis nigriterrae CENA67]
MQLKKIFILAIATFITTFLHSPISFKALTPVEPVLAQTTADRKAEADRLYQQGDQQIQIGQYKAALEFFQQALVIYQQIGDRNGEALSLNYIAIVERARGDYIQALKFYNQALNIFRELGDRLNEGTALNNIGKVYEGLGQYPQALEFYQQALAIRRQVGDKSGEGFTLGDLGSINTNLGQYPQALNFFQQSLDIFRQIGDQRQEALTLNSIGTYYRTIDQYPKALEYYQQAFVIFKKLGIRRGEGTSLNNIGDFRRNQGEFSQAQELFQQALAIFKEVGDRTGEGVALSNIGRVYNHQGQYPQALKFFGEALAIFREVGDKVGEARTLRYIGSTFYQSGKFVEAEKTLRDGIELLESLRPRLSDANKISIFETQTATYQLLQKVLIAQNKSNEALEISERGRARAFVQLLQSRLSPSLQSDENIPIVKTEEIQKNAKTQNSTLIQYSIISDGFQVAGQQKTQESELYIWVIKPTGEVTFRKVDLKPLWQKHNTSLKDLITTTRASMGIDDKSRSMFDVKIVNPQDEKVQKQSLQTLHKLLIQPIADLLPTDPNQRVVFVPQGDLFLVPFPALLDEKDKYLIEKHTILTSPSIQVLELTRQQRNKVKQSSVSEALVVGNPTMPNFAAKIDEKPQKLATLPGAKREAEAIAPILNTKALTGDAATETAIKAKLPQAKIIHLATHGLFDDFQGLQSAIALAPSKQDDGLLTAEEILDLKLNADLVVLSACNTGRGRITGDGVIGLSRSLFIAGTPSVIVSLWSVPDSPTAELMTEFYTNLNQNKLNKAQALRQAMLKIKQQYPNKPLNWAAFTLIGEAE